MGKSIAEIYPQFDSFHIWPEHQGMARKKPDLEKKVDRIDKTVAKISEAVENQGKVLEKQGKILEKHSEILEKHGEILEKHGEILEKHGEILEKHGEELNRFGAILEHIDSKVDTVVEAVIGTNAVVDKHYQEFQEFREETDFKFEAVFEEFDKVHEELKRKVDRNELRKAGIKLEEKPA